MVKSRRQNVPVRNQSKHDRLSKQYFFIFCLTMNDHSVEKYYWCTAVKFILISKVTAVVFFLFWAVKYESWWLCHLKLLLFSQTLSSTMKSNKFYNHIKQLLRFPSPKKQNYTRRQLKVTLWSCDQLLEDILGNMWLKWWNSKITWLHYKKKNRESRGMCAVCLRA